MQKQLNLENRGKDMKDTDIIKVCDSCLQASCWHGVFMCDEASEAGTIDKTVGELKKLKLEHPSYWEAQLNV